MAAPLVSPEVIVGHKNRLLLLVSAPLVYRDAQGELSPIVELDIDGEIEAIRETIEFYGDRAGFDLEVGYATVSKVALALTSKTPPTIFHFVGHGARKEAETCLILEDATGLAREFPLSELRAILTATDAPLAF